MRSEVYECDAPDCLNTSPVEKINKAANGKDALPPGWVELKMFSNTTKVKQIPTEYEVLHFDTVDCVKNYFQRHSDGMGYAERNPDACLTAVIS